MCGFGQLLCLRRQSRASANLRVGSSVTGSGFIWKCPWARHWTQMAFPLACERKCEWLSVEGKEAPHNLLFSISPCSNTPDPNERVVIRLQQSLNETIPTLSPCALNSQSESDNIATSCMANWANLLIAAVRGYSGDTLFPVPFLGCCTFNIQLLVYNEQT